MSPTFEYPKILELAPSVKTEKNMKIWPFFIRRLKKYEYLANFDKETEKVWKSGKLWQWDWKKYENLANFDKEIEKVWKSGKIRKFGISPTIEDARILESGGAGILELAPPS